MKILVTGGAGYIGSITAAQVMAAGHEVCILDDLSTGHRPAVPAGAQFVEGAVEDPASLALALAGCEAVIHFAGLSLVAESVQEPRRYFRANVGGALALLEGMDRFNIRKLVFSSSAAVYGDPGIEIIDEDCPPAPMNPYGQSKWMIEQLLTEEARSHELCAIALRYFNACGADGPRGEDHSPESHLIPRLCTHLLDRLPEFALHGDDYPTPDGSAIRDYVHVRDLARAHVLALGAVRTPGLDAINLGSGRGHSVKEVVESARKISGRSLEFRSGPRRPGDPPRLVASSRKAAERLGWMPTESSLDQILGDALHWHREHPAGYSA